MRTMAQKDIELILLREWASRLTMPIWIMGADGKLIFYNEPAEVILGRRYDEAGEMPLEELSEIFQISAEDGTPLAPDELPVGIALRQGTPSHMRVRYHALDGNPRMIDVTAFPIEAQGERRLGVVALFWEAEA